MAVEVVVFSIENTGTGLSNDKGFEATVGFKVLGLEGNAEERMFNALQQEGIPQRGDPHPGIPDIRAFNFTVNVDSGSPNDFIIVVSYKRLEGKDGPPDESQLPQISLIHNLERVITNFSRENVDQATNLGDQIVVMSEITETDPGEVPRTYIDKQTVDVSFMRPQISVVFKRREELAPTQKALQFLGKVNSVNFLGDGPRFWLCTDLSAESSDGGASFNVTYAFQRNPATWDITVIYVDADGRPLADPQESEGEIIRDIKIYDAEDFNDMNLGTL